MPTGSLRFVHAADLHLEQPIFGLSDFPDSWKDRLVDAPLVAAQRVFDIAIAEHADFLLLAGDVVDCHSAGARGIAFLLDQFQRLDEHNVAVYWAGGEIDGPDRWPDAVRLPDNVRMFAKGKVDEVTHDRDGESIATILGTSSKGKQGIRPTRFRGNSGQFTIAVAHGDADAESLAKQSVNYWALGGDHRRNVLFKSPGVAQYCGSPQSRYPGETGPHGCAVVTVDDEQEEIRTRFVATDSIRFENAQLTVGDDVSRDGLESQIGDRMLNLLNDTGDHPLLVSWTISAAGGARSQIRREGLLDTLTQWLRQEFGSGSPAAWTSSMELDCDATVPSHWYDEDTILGDFLRAVQEHQNRSSDEMHLVAEADRGDLPDVLAEAAEVEAAAERRLLLRQSALLGADLLRGTDAA